MLHGKTPEGVASRKFAITIALMWKDRRGPARDRIQSLKMLPETSDLKQLSKSSRHRPSRGTGRAALRSEPADMNHLSMIEAH
jgi:hypothetical protein